MKKSKMERKLAEKKEMVKSMSKDLETLAVSCAVLAMENSQYREKIQEMESRDSEIEETLKGYEERFFGEEGGLVITDIHWDGDRTEVFWNDGTSTVVNRAEGDVYNRQAALAFAISKKVLSGKLENIVAYYDEGEKATEKRDAFKVYGCLHSDSHEKRKNAEERWNGFPENVKQSVKETAKSKKHAWNA